MSAPGRVHDVVVVGSGPAGYSAALYLARADLQPVVFEGTTAGGPMMTTTDVENFPGFPDGVPGPGLVEGMRKQAESFGAEFVPDDVTALDLTADPKVVTVGRETHLARTVVLATGSVRRTLGVPGEALLTGHGISSCATCDGWFFADADVAVVGGGDAALEEALFLTRFARSVTVVHRRSELRAAKVLQRRAREDPTIAFRWNSEVVEALGTEVLSGVRVRDVVTGEEEVLPVAGLFVAVGQTPRSDLVRGQLTLDADGYVVVTGGTTRTSLPGVFAAGDVADPTYRQAATAAGTGCMAALDAERHLAGATAPVERIPVKRIPAEFRPAVVPAVAAPAGLVVPQPAQAPPDPGTPRLPTVNLVLPDDDLESLWEEILDQGWSDGLPVVPPTAARVARMLDGRDPDDVHVTLGTAGAPATMVSIAANAVMAGCRPAYFPAVLAALEGVAGATMPPPFASASGEVYLGPATPLLVFNGPIRRELGINSSHDMLSMTDRANATIGRALRLVLRNVGGALPGRMFDVQHGMPGRASMVFGEHEEESPWPAFAPGGSAVTVFPATGSMPLNYHQVPQRVDELLLILARCLDYVRGNRIGPWPDTSALVVLSPKHARAFSTAGWSKERLEDELTAAVNDHHTFDIPSIGEKLELINRGRAPGEPPFTIPMPDDRVHVLVAGGVAGWHSLIIPTRASTPPQTVRIGPG